MLVSLGHGLSERQLVESMFKIFSLTLSLEFVPMSLKTLVSRDQFALVLSSSSLVILSFQFSRTNLLIRLPCAPTFSMFAIWKNTSCKTLSPSYTIYFITSQLLLLLMTMLTLSIKKMSTFRSQEQLIRITSK